MKSPLRYPGAKGRFFGQIYNELLNINQAPDVFVEPFVGGASVIVNAMRMGYAKSYVLSDKDIGVASFWESVFHHKDELISKIRDIDVNLDSWIEIKHAYNEIHDGNASDTVHTGFMFFFLNRTSFSGITKGKTGPIGGMTQKTSKYKIECRFNKDKLIAGIERISHLASTCEISVFSDDANDIINIYRDNNNCVMYLDPPYYVAGEGIYRYAFDMKNHKQLRDNLMSSDNLFEWLLSYDLHEDIVRMYKGANILNMDVRYSMSTKRNTVEFLATNNHAKLH